MNKSKLIKTEDYRSFDLEIEIDGIEIDDLVKKLQNLKKDAINFYSEYDVVDVSIRTHLSTYDGYIEDGSFVVVSRLETDAEYDKRIKSSKRRSEAAKKAAAKRAEIKKEKDLAEYERLKKSLGK